MIPVSTEEGYAIFLINHVLAPDHLGLPRAAWQEDLTDGMIELTAGLKDQRMLVNPLCYSHRTVARAKGLGKAWSVAMRMTFSVNGLDLMDLVTVL